MYLIYYVPAISLVSANNKWNNWHQIYNGLEPTILNFVQVTRIWSAYNKFSLAECIQKQAHFGRMAKSFGIYLFRKKMEQTKKDKVSCTTNLWSRMRLLKCCPTFCVQYFLPHEKLHCSLQICAEITLFMNH